VRLRTDVDRDTHAGRTDDKTCPTDPTFHLLAHVERVSHWGPALDTLPSDSPAVFGPESFRDYLDRTGADPNDYRTATEISVDSRSRLPTGSRAPTRQFSDSGGCPTVAGHSSHSFAFLAK